MAVEWQHFVSRENGEPVQAFRVQGTLEEVEALRAEGYAAQLIPGSPPEKGIWGFPVIMVPLREDEVVFAGQGGWVVKGGKGLWWYPAQTFAARYETVKVRTEL